MASASARRHSNQQHHPNKKKKKFEIRFQLEGGGGCFSTNVVKRCSLLILGFVCLYVSFCNIKTSLQVQQQQLKTINVKNGNNNKTDDPNPITSTASTKTRRRNVFYEKDRKKPYGIHNRVPPPIQRYGPNKTTTGFVHDPQFVYNHPRPMKVSENICKSSGDGEETPSGAIALERIKQHIIDNNKSNNQNNSNSNIKLFCIIYTYEGGTNWTNAIWETWGKRCDKMLFASSATNLQTQHVHIPHISKFEGEYKGIWQKVRSIHAYLYDNFLFQDTDENESEDWYYHISGDDTYLIVDNLKEFLGSSRVQQHMEKHNDQLYSGFWIHKDDTLGLKTENVTDFFYMGGGSGYTLSKQLIKDFVEQALDVCRPAKDGQSAEDVLTAFCLRTYMNVTAIDTRDSTGAHRYHQLPVERHANFPKIRYGYSTRFIKIALEQMYAHYGWPVVFGHDYISDSSVAFHKYYHPDSLRRLEYLLYGTGQEECNRRSL